MLFKLGPVIREDGFEYHRNVRFTHQEAEAS